MILKLIVLFSILAVSCYTDIKENKIKNKYLLVSLICGLVIAVSFDGIIGLVDSLKGIAIPFISLFIFFVFRMFGAGDIKLYCIIGAIMGSGFIINNIIYTFFTAGIFAIFKLILTGKMLSTIKGIYLYFKLMFLGKSVVEFNNKDNKRFPFAIAIFIGTVIQVIVGYNFI